jgi:hypothetical protein
MPGEANISQTTTLPELKAPPEANMSQKEISANMNPPNILGEPSTSKIGCKLVNIGRCSYCWRCSSRRLFLGSILQGQERGRQHQQHDQQQKESGPCCCCRPQLLFLHLCGHCLRCRPHRRCCCRCRRCCPRHHCRHRHRPTRCHWRQCPLSTRRKFNMKVSACTVI